MADGGTVYAITNGVAVKFGVTEQNVESRLSALQTGNPTPLYIVAKIGVENPKVLERHLHQLLAEYRMAGEWFALCDSVERAVSWIRNPAGSLKEHLNGEDRGRKSVSKSKKGSRSSKQDSRTRTSKKSQPRPGKPSVKAKGSPQDTHCPQCGTNLSAAQRKRDRRRNYMREHRKKTC